MNIVSPTLGNLSLPLHDNNNMYFDGREKQMRTLLLNVIICHDWQQQVK